MEEINPVIKLCSEGMKAESKNKIDDALKLYLKAWKIKRNNYDAAIVAHYIARHQKNPEEKLRWNQEALDRANLVKTEKVMSFYPSLFVNLGISYESLKDFKKAKHFYNLASKRMKDLPKNEYGENIVKSIKDGLVRMDSI